MLLVYNCMFCIQITVGNQVVKILKVIRYEVKRFERNIARKKKVSKVFSLWVTWNLNCLPRKIISKKLSYCNLLKTSCSPKRRFSVFDSLQPTSQCDYLTVFSNNYRVSLSLNEYRKNVFGIKYFIPVDFVRCNRFTCTLNHSEHFYRLTRLLSSTRLCWTGRIVWQISHFRTIF